jgi:tetratricopeptide (TPR) repeat protein
MKKIKPVLKKTKIKGLPKIGLFLHAHLRHKLVSLTASWYQELRTQVQDKVELHLFLSGISDLELNQISTQCEFSRLNVTAGAPLGSRLNEGLAQLQAHNLDAVIPVAAGDFISSQLIIAYSEHLKGGGLFSGLLDQYFYDPNELKCVHWLRGEVKQGLDRACEIGLMISANMLDHLKWQLWPSQSNHGLDALHSDVMLRLGKIFSYAPQKTCLLQTSESFNGRAFVFKSELGRALFDEENWQQSLGQSDVDFEEIFEPILGEEWIDKIDNFDERVNLDVIIEVPKAQAKHIDLWREHYEFLPYKFDPYAVVKLRVITSEEDDLSDFPLPWQPVQTQNIEMRGAKWNQAVLEALKDGADLVLFGGKGSIVDLKTIEHFLIGAKKDGAKLLSAGNFFVAFEDGHQGHFWPGKENLGFTRSMGFGSCVHRDYLEQLGQDIFDDQGLLTAEAQKRFDEILGDVKTKHQRVLFQLVRHQLGLIAFEIDGAFGFSDLIRLSDLKTINISDHLHISTLRQPQRIMLLNWERGELDPKQQVNTHFTQSLDLEPDDNEMTFDQQPSSGMSALDRAKALLNQSKTNSAPVAEPSNEVKEVSTEAKPMSALERAKALLNQSQADHQKGKTEDQAEEVQPMSALDRAKALLQNNHAEPPVSNDQVESSTSASAIESQPQQTEPKPMSALEKAKMLLKASQNSVSTEKSSEQGQAEEKSEEETTQALLQQAMSGAEAMIDQLKATADAAKEIVAHEKENLNALAQDTDANSPAELLCERGEIAFEGGDIDQARTLFDSALMLDPTCVRALNNLGVMSLQSDEPWKALSHFLMGVIQDSQNEDLMINLEGLFDLYPELTTVRSVIFE